MAYSKEFVDKLEAYANEYIAECMANTKEHATGSGKVVEVKDRHIPTVEYFLRIWMPMLKDTTIHKSTYYQWLNDEGDKTDAIKRIDNLFKTLAIDIVANEGKGIFYAKNRLGMTDRMHTEVDAKIESRILNNDPL